MNQRLTTLSLGTTLLAAADGPSTAAQSVNALGLDLLTKGTEANGAVVALFDSGRPGDDLCLRMEWRKGNTVSASGRTLAMEKVWRRPIAQHLIRLNRSVSQSSARRLLFDPTHAAMSPAT